MRKSLVSKENMHLYLYVYGYKYEFQSPLCIDSRLFLFFLQPTLVAPTGQMIEFRFLLLPHCLPF